MTEDGAIVGRAREDEEPTEERTGFRLEGSFSRRAVLRGGGLGLAGLTAAALVGCGDDDDDDDDDDDGGGGAAATPTASAPPDEVPWYIADSERDGAPFPYGYAEPDTPPKAGGTMRHGLGTRFLPGPTFDPNESGGLQASLHNMMCSRLLGWVTGPSMSKYNLELEPELAKSWESSADGLVHTFKLQEGVKFHNVPPVDGRVLKSSDIKLAYDRALAGIQGNAIAALDSVETPDDQTVVLRLNSPDADFLPLLALHSYPILAPELWDEGVIETTLIGTGPTILEEVTAQGASARSNPDYFEGKPLLDGIEWRDMPDQAARVAAFRAGQIDYGNTLASSARDAQLLLDSVPGALVTSDPILNGTYVYVLNPNHPKFQDPRVRRALSLSVDRERLVELAMQGFGKVIPGFRWPDIFDEFPTGDDLGPWYKYDQAEATKLLSAAGADGLSFTLRYNARSSGPANYEAQNSVFVEAFRDVGVSMELENMEPQAYTSYVYGREFATDPGEALFGFISRNSPTTNGYYYELVHSESPTNIYGTNDPQVDEWAESQRFETDPDVRKELLRRIWDRYQDQVYRFDMANPFFLTVLAPHVRWFRYNSPHLVIYNTRGWGYGWHNGWLDK